MKDLLIYGSGGFGKEVYDLVMAINERHAKPTWNLVGYIDSDHSVKDSLIYGKPVLGSEEENLASPKDVWLTIAIGDGHTRKIIDQRVNQLYPWVKWASLIHPSVVLGSECRIGVAAVILAGSIVSSNAITGRQLQMNFKSTIGHDARLGDYVTLSNGAVINGDCVIGDLCFLGTNAVVNPRHQLGENVHIGSNVAVTKNIESNTMLGPALPRRSKFRAK